MKILDFMLDRRGQQVNLGFGSSFVFCDVVGDDIEEILTSLSMQELIKWQDMKKNKIYKISRMDKENWILSKMHRDGIERRKNKTYKDYIEEYKKAYRWEVKNLERLSRNIEKFVPYGDCTVKQYYPSENEFATIVIANENKFINGQFWDRQEYLYGGARKCMKY